MRPVLTTQEPPPPSPYPALFVKYSLIAIYGITSGIVGVATLDVIAGSFWAVIWPALVTLIAIGAIFAVARSYVLKKFGFELVMTVALIALLFGYVLAVVIRAFWYAEFYRLPTALLPVILSVFPWTRAISIVLAGRRP